MTLRPARISLPIETSQGVFAATYSEIGLCRLEFPSAGSPPAGRSKRQASSIPNRVRNWHALTSRAVARVLDGKTAGKFPPLDLSVGTAFQRSVWDVLCSIGPGQTLSYGEVACSVGKPKASRAVGAACGANPIPVLIPCHRVLAAGSKIGGFSAGLHWKRRLLAREGNGFAG